MLFKRTQSTNDYYPFGSQLPNRGFDAGSYKFGFNGKEKDDDITGVTGTDYDFGARIYDARLGRWLSCDPLKEKYPYSSCYAFALNTPIQALDPDGNLVIFVNGLMLNQALNHTFTEWLSPYPTTYVYPTYEQSADGPTYLGEKYDYWGSMVQNFDVAFNDDNNYFVNGSDHTWSEASERYEAGIQSGIETVKRIVSGELVLATDETIKIVGHSQGAAHAAGMAYALQVAYDNGIIFNKVEQITYLAPHQPTEINSPPGIPAIQYSRESDLVASKGLVSTGLISGGSTFGPINGITRCIIMPSMDGPGDGITGTRGGHNVGTYNIIFDLIPGQEPSSPPIY